MQNITGCKDAAKVVEGVVDKLMKGEDAAPPLAGPPQAAMLRMTTQASSLPLGRLAALWLERGKFLQAKILRT